jgi:ABC-type nickel/cobalt efflux system permease component RcnA
MKRKNFNVIASAAAFALGAIYIFSDSASITANVIGSSTSSTAFASIIGIAMIIGSMILFEVSMTSADTQAIDLERLIRRTKDHEEMYNSEKVNAEPSIEINKTHHEQHAHNSNHIHDKKEE